MAVCACASAVPAHAAIAWGISLDGVASSSPPAFSYQSNPYLTELMGGASCRNPNAICYARIDVPWDAINNGRGSFVAGTCAASPDGPGSPAAAFDAELSAAARLVGMSHVLVALTVAGSPGDDIFPTDADYQCGLSGLEKRAPGVREWEVFNEPDSEYYPDSTATGEADCTHRNGVWVAHPGNVYQCIFGGNHHGGSAQGVAYWYLDAKQADPNPDLTLVGGGFNYSTSRCTVTRCYYLGAYMRVLARIYPRKPDAIALHPYVDVNYAALNGGNPVPPASSGFASGQGAIEVIDHYFPSDPQIWFTEVGVWLTYLGKEPTSSGCGDGNPQDDGTWAACINGNPVAQALAAEGYLRLPSESPQVQRVYYYDFDDQNPGWDSGLVNINQPMLGPHGYGRPRTTWCVLRDFVQGDSPAAAASDAIRPGAACDQAQHGDAPVVDSAYLSDPLTAGVTRAETPGDVERDVMLTVADRIRTLAGVLTGSA